MIFGNVVFVSSTTKVANARFGVASRVWWSFRNATKNDPEALFEDDDEANIIVFILDLQAEKHSQEFKRRRETKG